jgi:hypothetical protein
VYIQRSALAIPEDGISTTHLGCNVGKSEVRKHGKDEIGYKKFEGRVWNDKVEDLTGYKVIDNVVKHESHGEIWKGRSKRVDVKRTKIKMGGD